MPHRGTTMEQYAGIDVSLACLCRSGWSAGDEQKAVEHVGREFRYVAVIRGGSESRRGPEFTTDEGQSVTEGGRVFRVPTDALGQEALRGFGLRCPERHERE